MTAISVLIAKANLLLKGDYPGHPFRGNQWTGGRLGTEPYSSIEATRAAAGAMIRRAESLLSGKVAEKVEIDYPPQFASSVEHAAKRAKEIHDDIVSRFPLAKQIIEREPVKFLGIIGDSQIQQEGKKEDDNVSLGGRYNFAERAILVSLGKGIASWGEKAVPLLGNGNVDYTGPGIFRHEFAHHLWDNSKRAGVEKLRSDFIRAAKKVGSIRISRQISAYAATQREDGSLSTNETFCESFSAWSNPRYGETGQRLPEEIESVMNKYFPRGEK